MDYRNAAACYFAVPPGRKKYRMWARFSLHYLANPGKVGLTNGEYCVRGENGACEESNGEFVRKKGDACYAETM